MKLENIGYGVKNLTQVVNDADQVRQGTGSGFKEVLKGAVSQVNKNLFEAQKMSEQLAAGEPVDVAQTMIAISKADMSFKLMVQVRNRAISAYEEIMRMQF